jgi:hypothetical protein
MPNGFLVCKNVPIARTGIQDYQGSELGIEDSPDEMFQVHREESEVFDPAALASFEGVSFVDEHPPHDVTVDNSSYLTRGFVKDVRRGDGADSDKMIADIIITDANVIAEIESGKREISCGYKCDYETDEQGRIFQRNIRGNHVALVGKGRAGNTVAIKDEKPQNQPKSERSTRFMKKPKNTKKAKAADKGLLAKFFGMVTQDADPDEVAEIAAELVEAVEEAESLTPDEEILEDETNEPTEDKRDESSDGEVMELLKELVQEVADMKSCISDMQAAHERDSDPLEELEAQLDESDPGEGELDEAGGEESVTEPVENMDESDPDGEGAVDFEVEVSGEETGSYATADAKKAIAKAKKTVLKIKDAKTRRAVSDAMAGMIRQTYGIKSSTPKGSYGKILNAKRANAKRASDSLNTFSDMEARQASYDARNPHKKKGGNS